MYGRHTQKVAGSPPFTEVRVPLPWYIHPSNVDSKAAKDLPKRMEARKLYSRTENQHVFGCQPVKQPTKCNISIYPTKETYLQVASMQEKSMCGCMGVSQKL